MFASTSRSTSQQHAELISDVGQFLSNIKEGNVEQLQKLGFNMDTLQKNPSFLAAAQNQQPVLDFFYSLAITRYSHNLQTDTLFEWAIMCHQSNAIKNLILQNQSQNKRFNINKIFSWAAKSGYSRDIDLLITEGADINVANDEGWLPLHYAAYCGHINVVRELFAKGANVNAVSYHGCTPLHYAAKSGHADVVTELLGRGADVGAHDNFGQTPLHCAASEGRTNVITILLANKADVNVASNENSKRSVPLSDAISSEGWTPLHYAAALDHIDAVTELLAKGAQVNAVSNYGCTPLHYAARERRTEIARALIAQGADANAMDKDGHNPLHYAKNKAIIELLTPPAADSVSNLRNPHQRVAINESPNADMPSTSTQKLTKKGGLLKISIFTKRGLDELKAVKKQIEDLLGTPNLTRSAFSQDMLLATIQLIDLLDKHNELNYWLKGPPDTEMPTLLMELAGRCPKDSNLFIFNEESYQLANIFLQALQKLKLIKVLDLRIFVMAKPFVNLEGLVESFINMLNYSIQWHRSLSAYQDQLLQDRKFGIPAMVKYQEMLQKAEHLEPKDYARFKEEYEKVCKALIVDMQPLSYYYETGDRESITRLEPHRMQPTLTSRKKRYIELMFFREQHINYRLQEKHQNLFHNVYRMYAHSFSVINYTYMENKIKGIVNEMGEELKKYAKKFNVNKEKVSCFKDLNETIQELAEKLPNISLAEVCFEAHMAIWDAIGKNLHITINRKISPGQLAGILHKYKDKFYQLIREQNETVDLDLFKQVKQYEKTKGLPKPR